MTFFKDSLNHSATICMKAKIFNLTRFLKDCLYYKIYLFTWHALNTFLDDMIAVLVIYTINYRIFKFLNKKLLLFKRYNFKSFLYNSTSIH